MTDEYRDERPTCQPCFWAFVPENRPSGLFFFCPDPGGRVRDAVRSGGGAVVTQYGPAKSDTACVPARPKNVFCPYGVSRKCVDGENGHRITPKTRINAPANKRSTPIRMKRNGLSFAYTRDTRKFTVRVHVFQWYSKIPCRSANTGVYLLRVSSEFTVVYTYFIVKIYNDVTNTSRRFPAGVPQNVTFA